MKTLHKNKFKKIVIVLIIFSFICVVFFNIPITISRSKVEQPYYYQTTQELVDNHDFVFIAKINKKTKTDRSSKNIPKTYYSIKQIDFIKGKKLSDKSQMCFYGGSVFLNFMSIVDDNDEFIKPKKCYLFVVNTKDEHSIDFNLYANNQKILLDGYDEKNAYTNQKEAVQKLIDPYIRLVTDWFYLLKKNHD